MEELPEDNACAWRTRSMVGDYGIADLHDADVLAKSEQGEAFGADILRLCVWLAGC
jgi:hypothetical protein